MKELYHLEVLKENGRSPKEYMICIVMVDTDTGIFRGFADRMTQVSFDTKIYVSGFFDKAMNKLTLLEISKSKLRKPNLYIFKDIDSIGEVKVYSDEEYKFVDSKPRGKAKIYVRKIKENEKAEIVRDEIIHFLNELDKPKDDKFQKIGWFNVKDIELELKYYKFFL